VVRGPMRHLPGLRPGHFRKDHFGGGTPRIVGIVGIVSAAQKLAEKSLLGITFFFQRVGAAVSIPTIPEKAGRPTRAWDRWGHAARRTRSSGFRSLSGYCYSVTVEFETAHILK